jgi:fluoroquinolone transport system permease protein
MRAITAIRTLGPIDLKNVGRDPMLRGMVIIPLALGLLLRYGLPALTAKLQASLSWDLAPYYSLVMSAVVQFPPLLFGTVVGFLLLDQRDDETLTALRVTPLRFSHYLAYRIVVPILLSVATTVPMVSFAGVVEMSLADTLLAATAAAPLAPLMALGMGALAQNKVQGFALQKASGVFLGPPAFAYFLSGPWHWAFGILPTFWPFKVWWVLSAGQPGAWLYLMISLVYHGLLLWLLLRRYSVRLTS